MQITNSSQPLAESNKNEALRIASELEIYSEKLAIAHEESEFSEPERKELLRQIAGKSITLAITIRAIGENGDLLSEEELSAALSTIAEGSKAAAAISEALQEAV